MTGGEMTQEQILCFLAVTEYATFLEASEQLHMGQGTLSKKIHKLEEELGTRLFDRGGRRVSLTTAGADFLPHAQQLRRDFAAMNETMEQYRLNDEKWLSIGSIYFGENNPFVAILSGFMQRYPQIHINNIGGTSHLLMQSLLEQKIDLAVVSRMYTDDEAGTGEYDDPRFKMLELSVSSYSAVLPAGHPLEGCTSVDYTQLAHMRLLTPYKEMQTYHRAFSREYEKRGMKYSPQYCESVRAVQMMVGQGLGYALLSDEVLEESDLLTVVPLSNPMYKQSVLLMLAHSVSRQTEAFFEYARACLNKKNE